MAIKAIFEHSGLGFWVDVAQRLRDEYAWDIPYFIGSDAAQKDVAKKFPNAIFHPNSLANKNQAPKSCAHIKPVALDRDLVFSMAFYETVFLKMMDRFDYDGSFTYQKRLFYYHSQVMYWKGVLDYFSPDVVVFRVAPHMGHDYVLHALCRVLGIKTLMFERTAIPGLVYPVESFEQGSDTLKRRIKQKKSGKAVLSREAAQHLECLAKAYKNAMPLHTKYKLENIKDGGALPGYASATLTTAKAIARDSLREQKPGLMRKNFYANLGVFTKKRLLAHYNSLAKKVDFSKPYIFVALQCEPERQTCPCGGVYGNQYLMVDALSKAVPDGWRIYVKEHVSQFKSYQLAERSRSPEFYDYINSMPNVSLVPLWVTSFDLIDNAMASATVSGTVGWESVVRGKPAFLFGHAWFADCDGVFKTRTTSEIAHAIKKVKAGFGVNSKNIKKFVSVLEDIGVRAYIDKVYEKLNLVSAENNTVNLSKCINDFLSD